MIKIRHGIFETNSSSTHSLIVYKETLRTKSVADELREHFTGDYFNFVNVKRDYDNDTENVDTINEKIGFICSDILVDIIPIILPIIQKYCPECKGFIIPKDPWGSDDYDDEHNAVLLRPSTGHKFESLDYPAMDNLGVDQFNSWSPDFGNNNEDSPYQLLIEQLQKHNITLEQFLIDNKYQLVYYDNNTKWYHHIDRDNPNIVEVIKSDYEDF